MKFSFKKTLRILLILTVLILFCGFQTTLWYQLFNDFPAPLLWINVITYLSIYRKPFPALMMIYLIIFIVCAFTAMPLKMAFFTLIPLFSLLYLIKNRVFWGGSGYYVIMCTLATFSYHVIYTVISFIIEKNHVTMNLFERFGQIILTPAFALPVYIILGFFDRHLGSEFLTEHGIIE